MTVRLFEILNTGWLTLMLRGKNLKDIEYFSKSDPFYEVRTKIGDEWVFIYRSEHVENELSPVWNERNFQLDVLCQGKLETPLLLSVYDHESDGKHRLLGEVTTNVNELLSAKAFGGSGDNNPSNRPNYLTIFDKKNKKSGTIVVINALLSGYSRQ